MEDDHQANDFVETVIHAVAIVATAQGFLAFSIFVLNQIQSPAALWTRRDSSFSSILVFSLMACFPVLHLAELVCGIGMWRRRRWAVPAMLIWCWIAVALQTTAKVAYWVTISRMQLPPGVERWWTIYDLLTNCLGLLEYFGWLMLLMLILRSKAVRNRYGSTTGGGFEVLPVIEPRERQNTEEH